ncbi:MAG: hypothetical protein ACK5LC_17825 [Coprobacillaceae bacterium]
MATRLEIAKQKAKRLEKESNAYYEKSRNESKLIPLGQPNIIGRGDIYKDVKRYGEKAYQLSLELDKQNDRVEMLEKVENFKNENELIRDVHVVGKTSYATVGVKTSVNNLEYFRNQLKEFEELNMKAKRYNKERNKDKPKMITYGVKITKLKQKIEFLEKIESKAKSDNSLMSDHAKKLIESGKVNQWKKKPIYYFVQGLKKVALVINTNGEFEVSNKYSTRNSEEVEYIKSILA